MLDERDAVSARFAEARFTCAGKSDGVINKENVGKHYRAMQAAGCNVTYKEFNFGHLDFVMGIKAELVQYISSRLSVRH